jgi:hypothetical protein
MLHPGHGVVGQFLLRGDECCGAAKHKDMDQQTKGSGGWQELFSWVQVWVCPGKRSKATDGQSSGKSCNQMRRAISGGCWIASILMLADELTASLIGDER